MSEWVDEEFARQQERDGAGEPPLDVATVAAALARWWEQLGTGLRQDVERASARAVRAEFLRPAPHQYRVRNLREELALDVLLDLEARNVRFDYTSQKEGDQVIEPGDGRQPRGLAPEGGILSLRPRAYGVAVFYSDQHLSAEQLRKTLLKPVLFPEMPSEEAA